MKHLILGILLSFPLYLLAEQGEGVNSEIDSSRLEEVRGYLHNAKMDLERGLNYVEDVPLGDKEAYLASMMEQVLNNSFGQNEFLMRNILHRTKVVYDELVKTPSSPKRDATARKILEENVERALSLYQMDQRLIENTDYIVSQMKPVDFAIVGMEWTEYVISRYMDLPTNESRLNVMAATLGLLYNDILDDMKHNRLLAPVAQHIETFYSLNKDEIEALKQASGDGSRNMEKLEMARKIFGFLQRAVKSMRSLLGEVESLNNTVVFLNDHISASSANKKQKNSSERFMQCIISTDFITFKSDRDSMRKKCYEEYKDSISFDQCTENAAGMYYNENEDAARLECFNHFRDSISFDQCKKNAAGMFYNRNKNSMFKSCGFL